MSYGALHMSLLLAAGFLGVCALKYIVHLVSVHRILAHVPGPKRSSIIWGEEWLLYHSRPGSHYVKWHSQFGKVLKFTGAFGVTCTLESCLHVF